MLVIENLTKSYGKKIAVKSLNLKVMPGDIYGFIGANGAGKTTTIKSIVGINDFDEGKISIGGFDVKKDALKAKSLIGYVADEPDLYTHISGREFINFVLDMYDVDTQTRAKNVEKFTRMFEMEKNLGDTISTYSHGMRQRLSLIASLSHEPKLLILDEPFVGLDPKGIYTVKQLMIESAKAGCAVFFSTHLLEYAQELCSKVGIIKNGELVADGDIDKVRGNESLEKLFMEMNENEKAF